MFKSKFKFVARVAPVLLLLVFGGAIGAKAQGLSAYFGAGAAWDSAGTSPGCAPGNLFDDFTSACEPGPTIGSAFGVFGADYMINSHLGFNGEYTFRFAQAPYLPNAGLNMRPEFYDFNVVWEPTAGSEKRIVPVIEGGIGGARIALYFTQQCSITSINCTFSQPAGFNANHFQVHAAAGVKLYVKGNLFIKPQFDFRYVPNLSQQFGHSWVPEVTASVGYTFGEH
jgi:hypothetical protein